MAATGHAVVLAVLRVALAAALAAACIAVCPETACPAPKDPALRHRERLLGPHFDGPCRKYGVSKALAMAVARQESSMHPYALNVAGRSVRPRSREEALRIADAAARAGKSYDVGLMQINAYWIRKYRLSHAALLDPRGNIAVGVWLLRQQINRHGPTWKAVGTYHSHTPWRRDDYARRVRRHLRNVLADYGGVPGR
jgi:soluble lytic murein transglycosylase-like protein